MRKSTKPLNIGIMVAIALLLGVTIGYTVYQEVSKRSEDNPVIQLMSEENTESSDNGDSPSAAVPRPGSLAPDFQLTGLDSDAVFTVGGSSEKPIFLNFWASWCAPCEEEAPMLVELYEKYKDQLDMYAVNVTRSDTVDAARAFADKYNFSFDTLMDYDGDVTQLYRVRSIPTNFLISRDGVIVDAVIGLLPYEQLELKIQNLIND